MATHENLFELPKPLSHYRAVVGSAQVVRDAWGEFGVVVTLASGALFRLENCRSAAEAQRIVDELNGMTDAAK